MLPNAGVGGSSKYTPPRPKPKAKRPKAKPKARTSRPVVDPYENLAAQMPMPSNNVGSIADYMQAANDVYAPTFDYLNRQSRDAQSRYGRNDTDLANMFGGLQRSIAGDAKGIAGNYNQGIGSVDKNTRAGQAKVGSTYSKAASDQAKMLKSLGIEAAGADTMGQNFTDSAFFQSMLQSDGNASKNLLQTQKQGALEYNTAMKNVAGLEGADARANNKLGLSDMLNQISGKRADLKTSVNQQAVQMQSSAADQQQKAMEARMAQMNSDRDYQMGQAHLALDTSKFSASRQDAASQQALAQAKLAQSAAKPNKANDPKDPWGKITQLASTLGYANNDKARLAIKAVKDAIGEGQKTGAINTWQNPWDLVAMVLKRNPGAEDSSQLTDLATYAYSLLFGKG